MKRISLVTLGCKANQYDTAAIMNLLPERSYRAVAFPEEADVYVIDTCTVTHKADAEARQYAHRAKRVNPNGVVVVTGCYAQVSPQEIQGLEGVDYIVGNSDKFTSLVKIIKEGIPQPQAQVFVRDIFNDRARVFESPAASRFPERTRATLKIQDGCNYRCAFCIIPYARGNSRSLPVDDVIKRMEILAESGYREIVLTGIHIASYGRDIGTNLLKLLREIDKRQIVGRVRLTSLDPADIKRELIEFAAEAKTVCPQFHVALQSGDAEVLRRMRRRYTPQKFTEATNLIREMIPDASIGTDVIAGFPGETDEEFERTFSLMRDSALTYFHVFPYSKRRGTPAAGMTGHLHPKTIKQRSAQLRELGQAKKEEFYSRFIGRTLPVLVERGDRGMTPNYISVKLEGGGDFPIGQEVQARIREIAGDEARGEVRALQDL
ncbi:MAG: tRNA (N(6)-L-threonylcarbamoyladenosine(37)-C(2))-methylthiotransferase MtaB [Deltaproteobacteria bacterium]